MPQTRTAIHGIESNAHYTQVYGLRTIGRRKGPQEIPLESRAIRTRNKAERQVQMTTLTNTLPEVAQHLRLGRTTVYRLIGTGELPSILIGGSRRVTVATLQSYLEGLSS